MTRSTSTVPSTPPSKDASKSTTETPPYTPSPFSSANFGHHDDTITAIMDIHEASVEQSLALSRQDVFAHSNGSVKTTEHSDGIHTAMIRGLHAPGENMRKTEECRLADLAASTIRFAQTLGPDLLAKTTNPATASCLSSLYSNPAASEFLSKYDSGLSAIGGKKEMMTPLATMSHRPTSFFDMLKVSPTPQSDDAIVHPLPFVELRRQAFKHSADARNMIWDPKFQSIRESIFETLGITRTERGQLPAELLSMARAQQDAALASVTQYCARKGNVTTKLEMTAESAVSQ